MFVSITKFSNTAWGHIILKNVLDLRARMYSIQFTTTSNVDLYTNTLERKEISCIGLVLRKLCYKKKISTRRHNNHSSILEFRRDSKQQLFVLNLYISPLYFQLFRHKKGSYSYFLFLLQKHFLIYCSIPRFVLPTSIFCL